MRLNMKIDFSRELALKIIYKIDEKQAYSNIVLDEYLNINRLKLNKKDINFISEIVYGVISKKLTLDTIIKKYSNTKLNKISKWTLNILRIGTYQIVFLDKVPKSAAVNECVNLAKKYNYKSANFVNAILRKIEKKDYEEIDNISDSIERLSKKYSMPEWIIKKLYKEYEIDILEQILKDSNEKPVTTIRINSLKTTKEEILTLLKQANIEYIDSNEPDFIHLKGIKDISNLEIFSNGYITVQDIGAGNIVKMLSPEPNLVILDACSAPGGKTTYMAEIMKNTGQIDAWDIHSHRIKLVEENAKRLGINSIHCQNKDATIFYNEYIEKYDKILLDVPCLGLGVMKRKPDIKWQKQESDIEEITKTQMKILQNCFKYLKRGGELVYSTCSILKDENEGIIEEFVEQCRKNNQKIKILDSKKIIPNALNDGFYMCKLYKEL